MALERFVLEQIAAHARHVAWPTLAPAEQAARLRQFVTRIEYDGTSGQVAILLRPTLAVCPLGHAPRAAQALEDARADEEQRHHQCQREPVAKPT